MREERRPRRMTRTERRDAIVDATIPLLTVHGRETTSRQIAGAAGIAEGTIYSVFEDKEELIAACVHRSLDSTSMAQAIERLPADLTLAQVVEHVLALTRQRVADTFALLSVLRFRPGDGQLPDRRALHAERVTEAVAGLLVRYRHQLRLPPRRAAEAIRAMALAMTHPMLTAGDQWPPEDIRDLILHGIVATGSGIPHTTAHPDTV